MEDVPRWLSFAGPHDEALFRAEPELAAFLERVTESVRSELDMDARFTLLFDPEGGDSRPEVRASRDRPEREGQPIDRLDRMRARGWKRLWLAERACDTHDAKPLEEQSIDESNRLVGEQRAAWDALVALGDDPRDALDALRSARAEKDMRYETILRVEGVSVGAVDDAMRSIEAKSWFQRGFPVTVLGTLGGVR